MHENPVVGVVSIPTNPLVARLNGVVNELNTAITTCTAAHQYPAVQELKKAANIVHNVQRSLQR